jgi:hypothetical protein
LVSGWFSFEQMGASAGDLMARDLACQWLHQAACPYDVALVPPFRGGVNWRSVDPSHYTHVVFVCGPFGNGEPITSFLPRFAHCRLVGLNLSMLQALEEWNPFDLLLERDSSETSRPDLAFLAPPPRVPIVGVICIDSQPEYGPRDLHGTADAAIGRLIDSREIAAVSIDTRLDVNKTGQRTAREIESLIARMDVVLTTRLHGMVLSLKNGVPAVAIDPVAGGAKVQRQAETLGWPIVLRADKLTGDALQEAFDYCLTEEARQVARGCAQRAVEKLRVVRDCFIKAFSLPGRSEG